MKRITTLISALLLCTASSTAQADFYSRLSGAAISLTVQQVRYDPQYFTIPYPNGDVPADRGVCTDVVIRAYRKLGVDLQRRVHEDMQQHFATYPHKWGMRTTDANIDHRRVPNLMTFFTRFGKTFPVSQNAADYHTGDIVCWDLGGGITHIGLLTEQRAITDSCRPLVVHNIGGGQVLADCLFSYKIIGHYRYGG